MSDRARSFVELNAQFPVVYGSTSGKPGSTVTYRLANGVTYRLTHDDCRHIGRPRWAHELECL